MESSHEVAIIDTPATTISSEESEKINKVITNGFISLNNVCNQFHSNYMNASNEQKFNFCKKIMSNSKFENGTIEHNYTLIPFKGADIKIIDNELRLYNNGSIVL